MLFNLLVHYTEYDCTHCGCQVVLTITESAHVLVTYVPFLALDFSSVAGYTVSYICYMEGGTKICVANSAINPRVQIMSPYVHDYAINY